MRWARYTRARPSASSALRPPKSAPCTMIPLGGPHSTCTASRNATVAPSQARTVRAREARVTNGAKVDKYAASSPDLAARGLGHVSYAHGAIGVAARARRGQSVLLDG